MSPCPHGPQVEFISFLRSAVCVGHKKDLFFRGWDNWPSDASYYKAMTDRIPTHDQLYFSIKHSSGDFVRPASWNQQLGVGNHAQIVEVELQREYEGKAACEWGGEGGREKGVISANPCTPGRPNPPFPPPAKRQVCTTVDVGVSDTTPRMMHLSL